MNPKLLFDNVLSRGTLTVTSSHPDYPVKNILNGRRYLWWKSNDTPTTDQQIMIECDTAEPVDYVLIDGHNLAGASITLYSGTGSGPTYTPEHYIPAVPDNKPIYFTIPEKTRVFWMIGIEPLIAPALANVQIGKSFELPGRIGGTFDPLGRKFKGQKNVNENGQALGSALLQEIWEGKVLIEDVPQEWLRSDWLPAWRTSMRDKPLALVWNSDIYPDEVSIATLNGSFNAKHQMGRVSKLEFTATGVYR